MSSFQLESSLVWISNVVGSTNDEAITSPAPCRASVKGDTGMESYSTRLTFNKEESDTLSTTKWVSICSFWQCIDVKIWLQSRCWQWFQPPLGNKQQVHNSRTCDQNSWLTALWNCHRDIFPWTLVSRNNVTACLHKSECLISILLDVNTCNHLLIIIQECHKNEKWKNYSLLLL